jgi:transcriptional regulator GlxA family with amidase domain
MSKRVMPKRIVMLAFDGVQLLDVTGPLQILAAVNDERPSDQPAYEIRLLAEKKGALASSSGLKLVADGDYGALPAAIDTLMVAGGEVRTALRDVKLIAALRKGAARTRRVASVCTGSFLLAEAGLLKGKRATTHWGSVELLAKLYPDVKVEADSIYVRDGRVWSSAGITAGMDLALALVREDFGEDMALQIARRHVLFLIRPGGQSQYSAHLAMEENARGKLSPLLRWIPEHVGETLDVPTLARAAKMSERNFARAFRKETGATPARYVERVRLDAARRMLTASELAVGLVAQRTGFGSEERMRRTFQRHLRVSPAAFRARFNAKGENA